MDLLNIPMRDGSRHFLSLPETRDWGELRDHIATLPGATVTGYVTDEVTEVWIDFSYVGYDFSVNNQFGEFWFFVVDTSCPEPVLQSVTAHCTPFLDSGL